MALYILSQSELLEVKAHMRLLGLVVLGEELLGFLFVQIWETRHAPHAFADEA